MKPPFRARDGAIEVALLAEEREILGQVPALAARRDDAGGRLDYRAHPDDEEAEARYRALVGDDLDQLREQDLGGFDAVVSGEQVDATELEAFARVVGEARLVLAARLGIDEDGWEQEMSPAQPGVALLGWLGHLQDAAISVLTDLL